MQLPDLPLALLCCFSDLPYSCLNYPGDFGLPLSHFGAPVFGHHSVIHKYLITIATHDFLLYHVYIL